MGKLALEIPLPHWDDFIEYCDFHYALADEVLKSVTYARHYRELSAAGHEVWLDNSYNELKHTLKYDKMLKAAEKIQPTHIFTLEAATALKNLELARNSAACLRKDLPGVKLITCWRGDVGYLYSLEEFSDIVALPYDEPRYELLWYNVKLLPEKYHYLGFNSIRELELLQPRSLDTSYPIRAAVAGIKFSPAEVRMTSGLGYYNRRARLPREQLALAKHNCKVLYEILHRSS